MTRMTFAAFLGSSGGTKPYSKGPTDSQRYSMSNMLYCHDAMVTPGRERQPDNPVPPTSGLHLARKSHGKSDVGRTGSPVPSTSGCQATGWDVSSGDHDDLEPLVTILRSVRDACDKSMAMLVSAQKHFRGCCLPWRQCSGFQFQQKCHLSLNPCGAKIHCIYWIWSHWYYSTEMIFDSWVVADFNVKRMCLMAESRYGLYSKMDRTEHR